MRPSEKFCWVLMGTREAGCGTSARTNKIVSGGTVSSGGSLIVDVVAETKAATRGNDALPSQVSPYV